MTEQEEATTSNSHTDRSLDKDFAVPLVDEISDIGIANRSATEHIFGGDFILLIRLLRSN